MNWTVFTLECIVIVALFTGALMISLCRNPVWWIHDYPKDIQEKYFETHEQIQAAPLNKAALIKKGIALIVALAAFVGLMILAGAKSFASAFLCSYCIWLLVNWYDCFVIDWVLFANIKMVRLPSTEHMDKAYHQKKYHVIQALKGSVLGVLPCLVTGLIVMIIK